MMAVSLHETGWRYAPAAMAGNAPNHLWITTIIIDPITVFLKAVYLTQ